MNQQTNSLSDYQTDYGILKLNENSSWETTRSHYRKMVHKWHPDKYTEESLEREAAQQKFIALSKSYNRLKDFYALHNRLPFEHTNPEEPNPDTAINSDSGTAPGKSNVDPDNLDMGTLSRDKDKVDERLIRKSPLKKILWSLVAIVVVVGTIMLFVILDRKANQEIRARGVQALQEAPESEFTPTASEIRRSESKGTFIRIPD